MRGFTGFFGSVLMAALILTSSVVRGDELHTDFTKLLDPASGRATGRLDIHLLQRGVASMLGAVLLASSVHTGEDIERTITAFDQSIAAMLDEGTLTS